MRRALVLLSILLSGVTYADSGNDAWRWYYASFESFEKTAGIFVRSGAASVKQIGNKIEINFRDREDQDMSPILVGNISNGKVNGILKEFFLNGDELALFGDKRSSQVAKNCTFDEIVLRTKEPTGSMLVLSRVTGRCQ